MLIQQKLEETTNFTNNEVIVAKYLIEHAHNLHNLSIVQIGKDTYTSPSTTVRLSKKLGYKGWPELREAYIDEINYIESHFQDIDPNIPFTKQDTIQSVSNKIAKLLTDTIADTQQLLRHDDLQKAVNMLDSASKIYVLAITDISSAAYDFKYKMRYLFKQVEIVNNPEDFSHYLVTSSPNDCFIFISYSGETFNMMETKLENFKNCKRIAISSIGDNSLNDFCDIHLTISTREKLSSKIASYVTNESVHYILDTLYSCLFLKNYDTNLERKLNYSHAIDYARISNSNIIKEK